MPGAFVWHLTAAEDLTLALAGVLAVLVALIGYRIWLYRRVPPAERERQRRLALVASGKMGDATLIEVQDTLLFYSYDVGGVQYMASQDVSALAEYLPAEFPVSMPVLMRYDPRNPANSIIVAESWSGLRAIKAS